MAMQQEALTVRQPRASAWFYGGVRFSAALITRPATIVTRALRGRSHGPRGYRREGFPEIELYQIIAGRKDRFNGL